MDLTPQGEKEACQAGNWLAEELGTAANCHLDYVFTSNLRRAIQTSDIIRELLADQCFHSQHVVDIETRYQKLDLLKERDYGQLTGLNKQTIAEKYGEQQLHRWRRSYDESPPKGESLQRVASRMEDWCQDKLIPLLDSGKKVLIVAHGNSLRALLVLLQLYTCKQIEQVDVDTGKPFHLSWNSITHQIERAYYLGSVQYQGYQVLDSRGHPTVMIRFQKRRREFHSDKHIYAEAYSPSGASTGSQEAVELRDTDTEMFSGKGVTQALSHLELLERDLPIYLPSSSSPQLLDVRPLDQKLIQYDGTENKSNLGGNLTTAFSMGLHQLGANLSQLPLYQYLSQLYSNDRSLKLPTPLVNIINGGKHAGGSLMIQECMIMPSEQLPFGQQLEMVTRVYHKLKKILTTIYGPSAQNVGDEGGFAPPVESADEALDLLQQAIEDAGLVVNQDMFLALDCAASEFYDTGNQKYQIELNRWMTGPELVSYYQELIAKYPSLRSIEDPFHETDYQSWIDFTQMVQQQPEPIMVVGDDLFTTNPRLLQAGIEQQWANALLLKVNQIGSVTEAVQAAKMMTKAGGNVIVSHRSGETSDTFIADLAVGLGNGYIKTGAPARGERTAKYNRLLVIEQELDRD